MSSMLSAPAAMPRDQARDLRGRVDAARPAGPHARQQIRQPGAVGEGHQRGQARRAPAGSGHRTRHAFSRGCETIALARCPLEWADGSVGTPIIPGQRAPFHLNAGKLGDFRRWIQARFRSDQSGRYRPFSAARSRVSASAIGTSTQASRTTAYLVMSGIVLPGSSLAGFLQGGGVVFRAAAVECQPSWPLRSSGPEPPCVAPAAVPCSGADRRTDRAVRPGCS